MILRKAGYSLQTSVHGKGAIRAVRQLKFEVEIVDIKLLDIMGDEVIRQIRKIDETMAVTLITRDSSLQDYRYDRSRDSGDPVQTSGG